MEAKLKDRYERTVEVLGPDEGQQSEVRVLNLVLRWNDEKGVEYEDLKRENDRLQNRVRKLIDAREEHTELVEYVEEERLDRQREREHREQRRGAPAWRRAKWWLLGTPDDE